MRQKQIVIATKMVLNCNLCFDFHAISLNILLNHIGRCHSSDPNFHILCGIDSCTRTYRNYRAFRNHICAFHAHHLEGDDHNATFVASAFGPNYASDQHTDDSSGSSSDSDSDDEGERLKRQITKANAYWLLKMKEENKMSQKCVDEIVSSTSEVVRNSVNVIKAQVVKTMENSGLDFRNIQGLEEVFAQESVIMNPFSEISNERSQTKFYKDNFGLVEPTGIILGQKHVKRRRKTKIRDVRESDMMYYIPLLESLQQLLHDESILEDIDNPHMRNDGLLSDFCDGEVFKNHPLFSRYPTALQIILYFDEFEVCNPIGTKTTKHKLGAFYFTLGNLRTEHRSQLKCIFLLALVKQKHLKKYGVEAVLEPFMADLEKLEQDGGHQFTLHGQPRYLRGSIAFLSADNLGAQYIGGLKEGSAAYRRCRVCMATAQAIANFFHERYVTLRTVGGYLIQCQHIERNDYYKKVYGINRYCSLNDSRYYHVVGGLPADAMHDILEGVFQYEVKELLKELIFNQQFFTLDELVKRMDSFDYGYYNDSNKPSPLSQAKLTSLDHNLKQKANQMWCLARFLPLLIGSLVPEDNEHWCLFCKLLGITDVLFAPTVSENQIAYVQVLIEEHHNQFKMLYPDSPITPKMHYMIHLPNTILRLGPLIRSWCFRFEAKHHYFKKLAMSLGNFKNIALTLAKRHQQWLCYQLQTSPGHLTSFLAKGVDIGPGKNTFAGDVTYYDILQMNIPTIGRQTSITESKWVTVNGTKYKEGCIVCVGVNQVGDAEFAELRKICVVERNPNNIRFIINKFNTLGWNSHFHAFEVEDRPNQLSDVIQQSDLKDYYLPLHFISQQDMPTPGVKFITPRHELIEHN